MSKEEKARKWVMEQTGWDEQRANRFLGNRVGMRELRRIPVDMLPEMLEALKKEAVPVGEVTLQLLIEEENWEKVANIARVVSSRRGGFVLEPPTPGSKVH